MESDQSRYFTRDEIHLLIRISIITNWCLSDFSREDLLDRIQYALTDPDRRRELYYELLLVDEGELQDKVWVFSELVF